MDPRILSRFPADAAASDPVQNLATPQLCARQAI
jgi:hypothetical protein